MACSDEIHLNDVGTSLEFEITECDGGVSTPVDITAATVIEIKFVKKDGTPLEVLGSIYTDGPNGDGTDGIVQYITLDGDIDVLGRWEAQVIITFPTGKYYSSVDKSIKVIDNL